jgi:hypothetical protein
MGYEPFLFRNPLRIRNEELQKCANYLHYVLMLHLENWYTDFHEI